MSALANNKKVVVVLPAFNAEKTLKRTLDDIPLEWVDDIILVDDKSCDNTVRLSKELGLKTFVHEKNLGYGANQKTCYKKALECGGEIMVMVHPDHQYDPKAVIHLIKPIAGGTADAVFGSRMIFPKNAISGGMPYWKLAANIFLTKVENMVLGLRLTEYHSGFRAYSEKVLKKIPFEKNSNDFVFDTGIIVQLKIAGFEIKEVPIPTRYFKEASMIGFRRSVVYGLSIFWVLVKYILYKLKLAKYEQFNLISKNST